MNTKKLKINNTSLVFTPKQIEKIEKGKNAKFVCDTEWTDTFTEIPVCLSIFYGRTPHPASKSKYMAFWWMPVPHAESSLMIRDGTFVKEQDFTGVIADDGVEVIYSRHRHDYTTSKDGSVFIDGGRAYVKSNTLAPERFVTMKVIKGKLQIVEKEDGVI